MLELDDTRPLLAFGGPYSNVRALEAMRRRADELAIPPSHVVCTGDVVAYCAEPFESVEAIMAWGCHVIAGNCEEQLAAGAADCGCNFSPESACDRLSKGWYPFAAAALAADQRTWMAGLPATLRFRYAGRTFRVVHGAIAETAGWVFASDRERLARETEAAAADVVIAGHSGIPFIARAGAGVWLNAGAIGMPANDGTPDGWYALITPEGDRLRVSTHRLAYDHQAAAAAMRRTGHANAYARALISGLWPSLDVLPAQERGETGKRLRSRSLVLAPAAARAAA